MSIFSFLSRYSLWEWLWSLKRVLFWNGSLSKLGGDFWLNDEFGPTRSVGLNPRDIAYRNKCPGTPPSLISHSDPQTNRIFIHYTKETLKKRWSWPFNYASSTLNENLEWKQNLFLVLKTEVEYLKSPQAGAKLNKFDFSNSL